MNTRRVEMLLPLIDRLERGSKKVGMVSWLTPRDRTRNVSAYNFHACGTAACLAGYAAMSKPFKREGLRLTLVDSARIGRPSYLGLYGYDALIAFFDLNASQAMYLFSAGFYTDVPSYNDLRDHVRSVLDGKYS